MSLFTDVHDDTWWFGHVSFKGNVVSFVRSGLLRLAGAWRMSWAADDLQLDLHGWCSWGSRLYTGTIL